MNWATLYEPGRQSCFDYEQLQVKTVSFSEEDYTETPLHFGDKLSLEIQIVTNVQGLKSWDFGLLKALFSSPERRT